MATSLDDEGVDVGGKYVTSKAWAFCNAFGASPGTVADSYNVSSLDDDGDGLSELHLSVTQPNDDFVALLGPGRSKGDTDTNLKAHSESYSRARSTTSVAFISSYGNATTVAMQDAVDFSITILGD